MEHKKKKIEIMDIASATAAVIFAVSVRTVFAPCGPKEDGSFMHCRTAGEIAAWAAVLLAVLAAARIASGNRYLRRAAGIMSILLCIGTMLIPGHIVPLCMMPGMRCRMLFAPGVLLMSAVNALLCAAGLYTGRKKGD